MSFSGESHDHLYILFLQCQSSLTATRPSCRLTCVNVSAFGLGGFIASLKNRCWLDFELVAICSDRHNVVHLAASGCNVAAVGANRNCLDFQIVAVFTHCPQIALLPASGGNIATIRADRRCLDFQIGAVFTSRHNDRSLDWLAYAWQHVSGCITTAICVDCCLSFKIVTVSAYRH